MLFSNPFLALSAVLASGSIVAVHADVVNDVSKRCLPRASSVCIGESEAILPKQEYICPDLTDLSKCGYERVVGGYEWTYYFIDGDNVKTGLEVTVAIEENLVECSVSANGEMCNGCSLVGCGGDPENWSVKYDCRNLENGIGDFSQCEPVDNPFLYPFELPPDATPIPDTPTSSSSGSSAVATNGMTMTLVVLLAGGALLGSCL